MKNIPDDLYNKIVKLSNAVKKDLLKKGVVVPVKNKNGSINVGHYKIVKTYEGYYNILNRSGDVVVDQINLPQTAAVVANGLALGKFKDDNLIDSDRRYGFALFDEILHTRSVENSNKKPLEYFDLMLTKTLIDRAKKDRYKQDVIKSFEKLIKLV
jgi:hypothetical protein